MILAPTDLPIDPSGIFFVLQLWHTDPVMTLDPNHLFVYGTLRKGFPHPLASRLSQEADHVGTAVWQGRLYDLGPYPGAVPSHKPHHRVVGDLFLLPNPSQALGWLDRYEGCSKDCSHPHQYARQVVRVQIEDATVQTWTYIYLGDLQHAELLSHGDYRRVRSR